MRTETTSVLVVGGGLVGLSAAVFLASRGVPTMLVEKHLGSSLHPRAVGLRSRTAEIYRGAGLAGVLPEVPTGKSVPRRVRVESLTGEWFEELHWTPPGAKQAEALASGHLEEYSPCRGVGLAQDRIEPILRTHAAGLGADLRLGLELVSFEQDGDGALAVVQPRDGGEPYAVRSRYLIAADGHRSRVRETLGIQRGGRGYMRTSLSVLFRAPLEEYLRDGFGQFMIDQPGFDAALLTYGDGRWVLMLHDELERDEAAQREAILQAIGRTDIGVEIITTGRWEVTASIAERFSDGRVFLAGDAAHTLPPSRGGYGANVGIEDAHNLAWKLAAVLSGESSAELLETYEAERRPVAWLCHQQIFARADGHDPARKEADLETIIDDRAMAFGILYRSAAVLGAGDDLPPAARPDEWAGQPGTRAPHLWLTRADGERLSTLDLFQRGWVLLTESEAWAAAAEQAAEHTGVSVAYECIGDELRPDDPAAFRQAYGLAAGGAGLVRPDGVVAWRSAGLPTDPASALAEALSQVAFPGRLSRADSPAA
ncbi:FAD-dependent monooxygenase [Flindersiella endophytica]